MFGRWPRGGRRDRDAAGGPVVAVLSGAGEDQAAHEVRPLEGRVRIPLIVGLRGAWASGTRRTLRPTLASGSCACSPRRPQNAYGVAPAGWTPRRVNLRVALDLAHICSCHPRPLNKAQPDATARGRLASGSTNTSSSAFPRTSAIVDSTARARPPPAAGPDAPPLLPRAALQLRLIALLAHRAAARPRADGSLIACNRPRPRNPSSVLSATRLSRARRRMW